MGRTSRLKSTFRALGAPLSAAVALAACQPVTTSKTRSVPISMRREKGDTRFPSKITMAQD